MNRSSKNSGGSTGISFLSALTIAFIVLKLCGVINWGWQWVLAPLWIPAAVIIAVAAIIVICEWVRR